MANADAPFGLRPVSSLSGANWKGKEQTVLTASGYATAVFIGDPVKLAGSADSSGRYPTVERCAAGDNIDFVVTGVDPDFENEDLQTLYSKASTEQKIRVVPVTDTIFEIQEDSVGGALAATDVGSVADVVIATGDTSTGISGVELDSDTAAASGSAQLRILGLSYAEDNEIGTNAVWRVIVNETNLTPGSTGL